MPDFQRLTRLIVKHAVAVTGANVQDRDGGQSVLKGLKDRFPRIARVWADGAYGGRLVEWAQKTAKFVLDIVCKPKGQIGFSVLWTHVVSATTNRYRYSLLKRAVEIGDV